MMAGKQGEMPPEDGLAGHDPGGQQAALPPTPASRGQWCLGAGIVLLVCGLLNTEPLYRPGTLRGFTSNVQIGEAQAWRQGRLDLPERVWDTALKDGKVYSYFPPMFTILAAAVVPLFGGVPHEFILALVAVVPLGAYALFHRLTHSVAWAVVFALAYVCGTSVWPVLAKTITYARPYHVNHTLASIGLLLMLLEYFGRRRVWPAAVGLLLAALSRQLTILYALPLVFLAVADGPRERRRHRLALAMGAVALTGGVYLGLNTLKFGHPLRTGYMLNHEGRNDVFAREAREHGTLSLHWVPRNLYYTNLGFPRVHRVTVAGRDGVYVLPNTMGTGIWWTTPLLLLLLPDLPRLLRERRSLALLGAAFGIYALLMLWHATGAVQRGYNRYSLDYLPVLLALLAPRCIVGRRRWAALAMIGWSIAYFRVLLPMPHVQVWGG